MNDTEETYQKITPERPWAAPPPEAVTGADYARMEGGQTTATRPVKAPRKRARRLLWLRWYGLPTRSEAAWHLTQLGKHFRSLTGFRP